MQLPSNKVGLVLIIVVLFVVGTIIFSKIEFTRPLVPLESVELVVHRNTDKIPSENWLDGFNKIQLIKPKPYGLLIEGNEVDPDSLTSKLAIDLFSEYLILKQKGLLSSEDEVQLTQQLSTKVAQEVSLRDKYTKDQIRSTSSTKETVAIYGDRVAQITLEHYERMDSFKYIKELTPYLTRLSESYQKYIDKLLQVSTPTVVADAHLALVNISHNTKVFLQTLAEAEKDPVITLVIMSQFQARSSVENELYTTLAQYFKNNDIIFESGSTIRFWNLYE